MGANGERHMSVLARTWVIMRMTRAPARVGGSGGWGGAAGQPGGLEVARCHGKSWQRLAGTLGSRPSAYRCIQAPPAHTAGTPRSSTTAPGSGRRKPPGGSGCRSRARSTGCYSWPRGSTPCPLCQASTCWAGRNWVSPPCRPGPQAAVPGPCWGCLVWPVPTAPSGPRPHCWHWTP